MIPVAYRTLIQDRRALLLLTGLGTSAVGNGMSTVTIAWLAVRFAPPSDVGLFVGLAVAIRQETRNDRSGIEKPRSGPGA
jgi:hypothetical protein